MALAASRIIGVGTGARALGCWLLLLVSFLVFGVTKSAEKNQQRYITFIMQLQSQSHTTTESSIVSSSSTVAVIRSICWTSQRILSIQWNLVVRWWSSFFYVPTYLQYSTVQYNTIQYSTVQ
jgi:hypothetical protein